MKRDEQLWRTAAAAVTLANEWRDTISYMGIALAGAYTIEQGDMRGLSLVCVAAGGRECMRALAWAMPTTQYAGFKSGPVNREQNLGASLAGASCFMVATGFALTQFLGVASKDISLEAILMASGLGAGFQALYGLSQTGKGIRDIPGLYFNSRTGMWDWPRKRGGGTTQTQKIKNGFKALGGKLAAKTVNARPAYDYTSRQSVAALLK